MADTTWAVRDADKQPEQAVVPNAVHCLDHGNTFVGPDVAYMQNPEYWDTCPDNDDHVGEPVHVTKTALGIGNDADFLIERDATYEYPLESL